MRNSDFAPGMSDVSAGASAGTTYLYFPVVAPFQFEGFAWTYLSTEANADNTFDFVIGRDIDKDGTFNNANDVIHTNANAVGLGDSGGAGQAQINKGDAGSGGGAATAVTPTPVRVTEGETIRVTMVRAGTGTVPAIKFQILGHYLAPGTWCQPVTA